MLKQYFLGTLSSRITDKEDSTTTLGDSEELSVEDPVGPPIPEFFHFPEHGSKRPSCVLRKDTCDVFPDEPRRPDLPDEVEETQGEIPPGVVEAASFTRRGEGLTGRSSDEQIDSVVLLQSLNEILPGDISEIGDARPVVSQDRIAERVHLGKPCWPHP